VQIRRAGRQPHEQYAMVPNATARDNALSFRARGVFTYLLSQTPGWRITTETVAREGREGREAVRAAFRELEDAGYIRRVRVNDERGRIVRWCDVYPYGDAPELTPVEDADIPDEEAEAPETGNQTSGFRALVDRAPSRRLGTEDSLPSPSDIDAAPLTTVTSPTREVTSSSDESTAPSSGQGFPIVEQRKLTNWFGVGAHEGDAWVAAWETARSFVTAQPSVEYDPQAHLAIYLSRCREERRRPRSDLWLRFFIEDRAKHIEALQQDAEARRRGEETPQEREDRLNRRLPPVWGEAAAAETGAEA
jgi:hypothetical protein